MWFSRELVSCGQRSRTSERWRSSPVSKCIWRDTHSNYFKLRYLHVYTYLILFWYKKWCLLNMSIYSWYLFHNYANIYDILCAILHFIPNSPYMITASFVCTESLWFHLGIQGHAGALGFTLWGFSTCKWILSKLPANC